MTIGYEAFTQIKEMIKRQEGLRLKPYRCTEGFLTIGYGRNLDANGINLAEANLLFEHDVLNCEASLAANLDFYNNLSDVRKCVLLDMAFQIGVSGLLKFKNTLEFVRKGEYVKAAEGMLNSLWAKQTPNRAKELSEIMEKGDF